MKKIINVLAFIIIIGFVGSWDCGNCDFKTMLLNMGVTLSMLFTFHIFRLSLIFFKAIKKSKRHKLNRVKIY